MPHWDKEELELKKGHGWKGKSGHKIFVGDRGAIRFDYSEDWVVIPDDDSIKFYDKQPPDDDSCLAVSYMRLPPVDLSGLPVSEMLKVAMQGDTRPIYSTSEIHAVKREDLELAWCELSFIDPAQQRDCRSRICLGRGSGIQPLITMEFWEDDRARCAPVWDGVLDSLQLGVYIEDPTRGPIVQ
jgi:hypothetical protein